MKQQDITEQELDDIRAAQETFLPTKVIIRRREFYPPDDYDHRTTVAEDVDGRFSPGFGQFRNIADQFASITPFTFTAKWDQDIREDDHLIDPSDRIYHVRAVKRGSSYQTATQCLVDQVNDNA